MRGLAFVVLLAALIAPLAGSAAPTSVKVGFAPAKSQVIRLVGGHIDGQWVRAKQLPPVAATEWQTFTLTGAGPKVSAGAYEDDENEAPFVPLKTAVPVDFLAVTGPLVTQPRKGCTVKADIDLLEQVKFLLRSRGVRVDRPRVVQCVKVDLLGDGDPEWLVVASSRDDIAATGSRRTTRDYALAAMAWVTPRGSRRASALVVEPIHVEGPGGKDGVARGFRWVGVADVDGKGRMVAALRSESGNGGGMEVLSFDGTRVKTLVSEEWGPGDMGGGNRQ